MIIPDFVVYADSFSTVNHELQFVEVKRKGNCKIDSFESGLVRLGKEMQITMNMLVLTKNEVPTCGCFFG